MALSKTLNAIKVKNIQVYIYKLNVDDFDNKQKEFNYQINITKNEKREVYKLFDDNTLVHKSIVFYKVGLLKAINSKGHVIGGCFTNKKYRGKGIYPKMLNLIAQKYIHSSIPLFIVVDQSNLSSINGIEKSGFTLHKRLKTKRILNFFLNKRVT